MISTEENNHNFSGVETRNITRKTYRTSDEVFQNSKLNSKSKKRNRKERKFSHQTDIDKNELGSTFLSEFHHRKFAKNDGTRYMRKKKFRKNKPKKFRKGHKDQKQDRRRKNAWKSKKNRWKNTEWDSPTSNYKLGNLIARASKYIGHGLNFDEICAKDRNIGELGIEVTILNLKDKHAKKYNGKKGKILLSLSHHGRVLVQLLGCEHILSIKRENVLLADSTLAHINFQHRGWLYEHKFFPPYDSFWPDMRYDDEGFDSFFDKLDIYTMNLSKDEEELEKWEEQYWENPMEADDEREFSMRERGEEMEYWEDPMEPWEIIMDWSYYHHFDEWPDRFEYWEWQCEAMDYVLYERLWSWSSWDSLVPIYAANLIADVGDFLDSKYDLFGSHQTLEIVISFFKIKNHEGYYYVIPKTCENEQELKILDKGDILETLDNKTGKINQYLKANLRICFVNRGQIYTAMLERPGFDYLQLQNSNQELLVFCDDQDDKQWSTFLYITKDKNYLQNEEIWWRSVYGINSNRIF